MFGTAHPACKRWPWNALSEEATGTFLLHMLQGSAGL